MLVTGGGPIGLLIAEVDLAHGAAEVVLTDVVADKLELAAKRGVQHTVDVSERDPVDMIHERIGSRGVDTVVESSGAASAIASVTAAVRRGGTVVFVGIPHDAGCPRTSSKR